LTRCPMQDLQAMAGRYRQAAAQTKSERAKAVFEVCADKCDMLIKLRQTREARSNVTPQGQPKAGSTT
jgi:hypothetical protein